MTTSEYVFVPAMFSEQNWNALASVSPNYNLLQSWGYAEAKVATGPWQVVRGIIQAGNQNVGVAQILIRTAPLGMGGLAWLNRGPLSLCPQEPDASTLYRMMTAIKKYFVEKQKYYLRVAPPVETGVIDSSSVKMTDMKVTDTIGWASAWLDLSKSQEDLRRALHGKWRNALSRAERADIAVSEGMRPELFQTFLAGHREHLARLGPHGGLPEIFLSTFHNLLSGEDRLETSIAYVDGRPVGGIIIAKYGKTAEYLAGHNTDEGRANNVGQLLLWRAICSFQRRGFSRFDLGGMDPILTPEGIFRFKQRIGAQPYRYTNELESGAHGLINRLVRWRISRARGGQ